MNCSATKTWLLNSKKANIQQRPTGLVTLASGFWDVGVTKQVRELIQSLSFTIQSHLYPMGLHTPPPFPQQEALNAHTVCFKTWRACIQKEKVEENSCIENICTVSSLPPQTAGASTVYEKRTPISTQLTLEQMFSLLGGVNEKEKRLSAALLNKMIQPRFKMLG